MARHALAFVFEKRTKFSLSTLIGVVEGDGRFDDFDIHLLRPKDGLAAQVGALARKVDSVVLGYSFTTPNALAVRDAVQEVRGLLTAEALENVTLVAGGPHPSGDWGQTLGMGFDIAVVGEGERSFPDLLAALYNGHDIGRIRGLAYRQGAECVFTGRSQRVVNLDDYPPFAARFGLFSTLEITRGCPWGCKFCQATFLFGGRMRHRSVENIAHWAAVSRDHDRPEIRFVTPDAFAYGSDGRDLRLDRVAELLQAVNDVVGKEHTYLGSFPSEVRPETVSEEAVALIRRYCANDNIIIGAQSGSQRLLDLSHRGHSVQEIVQAVRITQAAGLVANVDFIFGMPGETETDREQTRELIKELASMGARVHSHAFMPLAGTPWADEKPGRVDYHTRQLLYSLAGDHQQYGQWRKQERVAQAIVGFRESIPAEPCATVSG